ncbi:VOC family protein [Cribrihabitans neustonicus]|uniref:VOC family protein n=1 Tax=Cribrihabitans neustonicus TaxID=1429085 RepID=UPI003B5BA84A
MSAQLEHANITVADPQATAAWMGEVFGWHIRWEGPAINGGYTVHVGGENSYLALFRPAEAPGEAPPRYSRKGALNHLAVVVADLDATEAAVKKAGFEPVNHADYEPGRRFYFLDGDGVEYEAVQYDE